jgi:hypothetical protein
MGNVKIRVIIGKAGSASGLPPKTGRYIPGKGQGGAMLPIQRFQDFYGLGMEPGGARFVI